MVPKDLERTLNFSGGVTFYKGGPKRNKDYNQVPTISTKDLKKIKGNAIKASSFSATNSSRRTVAFDVTGDETTWGDEGEHTELQARASASANRPVDEDQLAPAGENRPRRKWREKPPFGRRVHQRHLRRCWKSPDRRGNSSLAAETNQRPPNY